MMYLYLIIPIVIFLLLVIRVLWASQRLIMNNKTISNEINKNKKWLKLNPKTLP